jgi:DNA repair protein RadC
MKHATHLNLTDRTLFVRDAAGQYHIAPSDLVIEECLRRLDKQFINEPLDSPKKAGDWCVAKLSPLDHEVFACIFLDNQHRVIAFSRLFRGTIDGASVYPREVVKAALNKNAAAVIMTHNHPSGMCEPSEADKAITQRLKQALALVEIRTLDHFIVGGGQWYSLAEHGLI